MTALPEAKLAREAEICYAMLAAVTDYDAWQETHTVDATAVFETLSKNVEVAQKAVRELAKTIPGRESCECGQALDMALVTNPEAISAEARERLKPILARRLGPIS
jgi:5'-methylthioadenosine phosphorylase